MNIKSLFVWVILTLAMLMAIVPTEAAYRSTKYKPRVSLGSIFKVNQTPPNQNVDPILSPANLPATGGILKVTATVVIPTGKPTLTAYIYTNGAYYNQINMTNGGVGHDYVGTLTVGNNIEMVNNNTGSKERVFTATVIAVDSLGNKDTATAIGTCVQAFDNTPPVITNAVITPATRPIAGGTINISATVTDADSGVNTVGAVLLFNGLYISASQIHVNLSNGGSGNVYRGSYTFGANTSNLDINWTAKVIAADKCGNASNINATGSCLQPTASPSVLYTITEPTLSPVNVSIDGGQMTFSCKVTPLIQDEFLYAELFLNNLYLDSGIRLNYTGADGIYTGIYNIGKNNNKGNNIYKAIMYRQEGNIIKGVSAETNVSTQAFDATPPSVTDVVVTPATLPASGGKMSISSTVIDAGTGVRVVYCQIIKDGIYITNVSPVSVDGANYNFEYTVPVNAEPYEHDYSVCIVTEDNMNLPTYNAPETVCSQSADNTYPVITSSVQTPATLPATGGKITVSTVVPVFSDMATQGVQIFKDNILATDIGIGFRQNQPIRNPLNNHVYKMVPGAIAWTDAKVAAEASTFEGAVGHLATVSSAEEMQFIKSQLGGSNYCWLGGYQDTADPLYAEPGGAWKWVTDEPFNYTSWITGYPNNAWYGTDDYLTIWDAGDNWRDAPNQPYWYWWTNGGYIVEYDTTATTLLPLLATYDTGSNTSTIPHIFSAISYLSDTAGNKTVMQATGTTTLVNDNKGPAISGITFTPATLTVAGGDLTFSATITESAANDCGIYSTYVNIYRNGVYTGYTYLSNGGAGTTYTGTFNVGMNTTPVAAVWTADVVAIDNLNNTTTVLAPGNCTQASDSVIPSMSSVTITPVELTANGGTITLRATVTDGGTGVNNVIGYILRNGIEWVSINMSNGGVGNIYTGAYNAGLNHATEDYTYTGYVKATDRATNIRIIAATGSVIQATDKTAPVITGASLTPATIPDTGGTVTVTATVTDAGSGLSTVRSELHINSTYNTYINLTNTGGNTFTGTLDIGANTSNVGRTWKAIVYAIDNCSNVGSVTATGAVSQPTSAPGSYPTIANGAITPVTLPATGGNVTITADVSSGSGINEVAANILRNGLNYATINLIYTGTGDSYSGTYNIPANAENYTYVYTAAISATDGAGFNITAPATGTCTQANDHVGPNITAPALSPSTRPATGGTITVTATVEDGGVGVSYVYARIFVNNIYQTNIGLSNGGDGILYTGTYTFGNNAGPGTRTFKAVIDTQDILGNNTAAPVTGTCVQSVDANGPVISVPTVSPATISPMGGPMLIQASVADSITNPTGVGNVTAVILRDGAYFTTVTLAKSSGNYYKYSYNIPANSGAAAYVYTAVIYANDNVGTISKIAATGSATQQPDNHAPVIDATSVTPANVTANGGIVTVSAIVTDTGGNNAGVKNVYAYIKKDGINYTSMTLSNGGVGNLYTGKYSVPTTIDKNNHTYTFSIVAYDNLDNLSTAIGGTCFQRTDTDAGGISGAVITPNSVAVSGGTLTVNATVSGAGNVAPGVSAQIKCNGFIVATINLAVTGGTETTLNPTVTTGNYSGTYTIPANTDGFVKTYTASVYSTDMFGLASAGLALGECVQSAGAPEGPLPVISNMAITPASAPVSGCYINVSATITGTRPVNYYSVYTNIYRNGIYYTWAYLYPDLTGNRYSADISIPANTSGISYTYTASIVASDGSRSNSVVVPGASVQASDNTAPVVTGTAIAPVTTISTVANTLMVSANITDIEANASGLNYAYAYIYRNGQYVTYISMGNGGIGTGYSAEYAIPVNNSKASVVWSAAIKAVDNAGNITLLPVTGNVTQPKDNTAPVITSPLMTPISRPSTGGTITISATVTDAASGVYTVRSQIYANDLYYGDIALTNGGGGTVYTGEFNIPANTTMQDLIFTARVVATDNCGNVASSAVTGTCEQLTTVVNNGLDIGEATMTPANLPASGGEITFTSQVTGLTSNQRVVVYIMKDNVYYTYILLNNTGNGTDFSGTLTVPANTGLTASVYTSTTWVQRYSDYGADLMLATTGSTTVATDNTAPVISSVVLSPANITIAGGTLSVSANVTDAGIGVQDARAEIFKNSVYYTTLWLTNSSGSTFDGTYNISTANKESAAWTYTAVIVARDVLGNTSTLAATGIVTQPNDAVAPTITLAGMTPATLPATGGMITLNATISDASAIADRGAWIYKDGVHVANVNYYLQNQLMRNPANNHVYMMVPDTTKTWSASRDAAAATSFEGVQGHLATITSLSEQQFITSRLGSVANAWIGGYQDGGRPDYSEPAGGWRWVTDEPFDYTSWMSTTGQPDDYYGEWCLAIYYDGYYWNDWPDNITLNGYVIEYDTTGTAALPTALFYSVGPNKDAVPHTYTAVMYTTDIAGNTTTLSVPGTTVQATDNVGPAISNTSLTPTNMSAVGGTIYISATVTDIGGSNTGVKNVSAAIYQNGINYTQLTLSNGGSGDLYTGEINMPANKSQMSFKYAAMISATDNVDNRSYVPANGVCIQATSINAVTLSPAIAYPEIGPKAITSLGGDLIITAKVSSPVGVNYVNAQIFENGVYYTTISLTRQNDGITFTGRYGIPVNSDLFGHIFTASILAYDNTDNYTSHHAIGSCVQATDSGIPTQMIPAPTITSFTPSSAGPNMTVTITGTNFMGVTSVLFDGNYAQSYTVVDSTTINAVVAPDTTSGLITVTAMGGIAESATPFTYVGPVSISGINPNIGGVGTVVNITGANFETTSGVTINGTPAAFTVVSPTSINATVAVGTTTGPIVVTTMGGTASSAPFTFVPVPTITSFTPTTGPLGQLVTITGTNLATAISVKFNGVNAASFAAVNNTTITATIAAGTTTGKVTVVTLGGTVLSAGNFTFIPAPTITSFTPTVGDTGTVVAITGTNFLNASSVKFNNTPASAFTVVSSTRINATVAVGTTTGTISVTTPGGTGVSVDSFTFMPKPTITFFTPATGGAGTVITIIGTNLAATSTVKVGGITIPHTVVNDTVVTAEVSAATVSGNVAVTTIAGTATSTTPFTFIPAPTITSFTPEMGIAGTLVTITGTNFTTAKQVTIGGIPVIYTVMSPTTINAVASVLAVDGNIAVTTHGGTATSTVPFTFIPTMTSLSPAAGVVGKVITISGTHLTGATSVMFNGATAVYNVVNSTTITATVPATATTGLVEVTTPGGVAVSAEDFVVIPTLSAVTVEATPASPRTVGTVITLTANATGGASVLYKFMNGTVKIRDFAAGNTCTWTPASVKLYNAITVVVRDAEGVNPDSTITSTAISVDMKAPLTAVTYTTSLSSPWVYGAAVTFTATATGGAAVQYKYMDGDSILRDFAESRTFEWIVPEVAGNHNITVIARDLNGINPEATVTYSKVGVVVPTLTSVVMTTTPQTSVLFGSPVTLTAIATGGLNVQYKFMNGTVIIRDFSGSNTATWTPSSLKTYTGLTVIARDLGGLNPAATVTSPAVSLTTKSALTAVTMTTTPAPAVLYGSPVTLTATATGGVNVQYKFMNGTVVIRDFAAGNTATWTPASLKTYTSLTVIAKDLGGANPATTITSPAVSLTTKLALSGVTMVSSPSGSALFGVPVTLTATAINGVNVQYKFMNGSTVVRDFSAGNTFTWTPSSVKTYNMSVVVRDLGGADPAVTFTASVNIIVKAALTSVSMVTNPSPSVVYGMPVTLTATATGGMNVQYKFMNGTVMIRDFAAGNTATWTPSTMKTYTALTVIAKDLGGIDPAATVTSPAVSLTVKPALTAVALTTVPTSPSVINKPVTLTATATGGVSVLYKFMSGTTILRDYESGKSFIWTPTVAETVNLTVMTKDTLGTDPEAVVSSDAVSFTATEPLTGVTLQALPNSVAIGNPVTLTANATGGASLQYKFMNGTITIRNFAASNTCSWTPATVKTYSGITVIVKDLKGIDPAATVTSPGIDVIVTP